VTWDFFQRYDDSWIWRRVDRHDITESNRNFAGFEECVADAARYGYVPPQAERSGAARHSGTARKPLSRKRAEAKS
jgi:hypothetical protein